MLNPDLLDEHPLEREDFEVEAFHEIVFASIYNLYQSGIQKLDDFAIDQFLSVYPTQYKIFNDNKGLEWINDAIAFCEPDNFLYYYRRLKKLSYLRYLKKKGVDTTFLYNPEIIEPEKLEKENAKFDALSIEEIIDQVETRFVTNAKLKFISNSEHQGQLAGTGMRALKESLKQEPEFGLSFLDPITTTVARGARKKKFYLYSGSTGSGKTRMTISSLCQISIPWIFDLKSQAWIYTGMAEPGLFISTELEFSELQTIIQAYVSGVSEEHIIDGKYGPGEEDRVDQAITYIESSPMYLEWMPDFSITDVENVIKKYKRVYGVSYVVFDYIHTSAKLIAEIGSASNGMKIREDQCLFLLSDKLKNLCNTLDLFILSGTQLNEGWKTAAEKDSTILRGAKSLADRIDLGVIFLEPSRTEMEAIQPILSKQVGMPIPNRISHVYKCRKGKYARVKLWQHVDLSTCRMETLFATDHDFKIIPIQATRVVTEETERLLDEHSITAKEIACTKKEQEAAVKALFDF